MSTAEDSAPLTREDAVRLAAYLGSWAVFKMLLRGDSPPSFDDVYAVELERVRQLLSPSAAGATSPESLPIPPACGRTHAVPAPEAPSSRPRSGEVPPASAAAPPGCCAGPQSVPAQDRLSSDASVAGVEAATVAQGAGVAPASAPDPAPVVIVPLVRGQDGKLGAVSAADLAPATFKALEAVAHAVLVAELREIRRVVAEMGRQPASPASGDPGAAGA